MELLERPDPQQRIQGYRQRIQGSDPSALEGLRAPLEAEKDPAVRRAVVELLEPVPHPDALSLIAGLAKDADARVRVAALKVLGSRPEPDAAAVVVAMMFDGDPSVSRRAEKAAMDMGKERLVGLLGDMVKSDKPWKVKAAVKAAGRLNSRQMVPILEGAYLFGDEKTRERALHSLQALSARGNPAAVELLDRIRREEGGIPAAPVEEARAKPLPPPLAESDEMPVPYGARVALEQAAPVSAPPEPDEIRPKPARRSAFGQAGSVPDPVGEPLDDAAPPPRVLLGKKPDLRKESGAAPRPAPRRTGLNRPMADPGDPEGGMADPGKVATRACPMCAEEIPRLSVQCPLCGEVLSRPGAGKADPAGEPVADWRLRLVSYLADSFAAGMLNLVPIIGPIFMLVYLLVKDGLNGGQSPGKGANDLRVIDDETGAPCTKRQSAGRNLILCIPVVGFIELLFVILSGRRLGDRLAGTRVIRPRSAPEPRWVVNYIALAFFIFLPLSLVVIGVGIGFSGGLAGARESANLRACHANQRTMMGAIEMYNLDNGTKEQPVTELTPEVLQTLVAKGYLQSIPTDPGEGPDSTGNYSMIQENPIAIGCSRHGSVVNPPGP